MILLVFSIEEPRDTSMVEPIIQAVVEDCRIHISKEITEVKGFIAVDKAANEILDILNPKEEVSKEVSNLVLHARREMEILGCNQEDIEQMVVIIRAFADVGSSGGQASWIIPILHDLLQFKNLTPLSDDPKDWIQHEPNMWQSCRRSDAFSPDGGKSYYLLSEGANSTNQNPLHKTITKKD